MKARYYKRVPSPAVVERPGFTFPFDDDPSAGDNERVPLPQYFASLRRHWLKIAILCTGSLIVAYVVSKRITPVYEATASLEIDRQNPAGLIGHDSNASFVNDSDQYLDTQVKIIQQDSVLRPVAERFALTDSSQDAAGAPVRLKRLRVVRPPNTYLLQINYRSSDPVLAANVANAIAQSYLQYTFHSRLSDSRNQTNFMEHQLDELRASMEKSSAAVSNFERQLGVVDADEKTNILSARLMQLNTDYTDAQADRIKKEAEFAGLEGGSVSAAEASDQGEGLKRLNEQLHEAEQKFSDVKQHFGPKHPVYLRQAALIGELKSQIDNTATSVTNRARVAYQDAAHRENILHRELTDAKGAYDQLNSRSFQYQTLKMEAQDNRKLYDDLEQRIKEAGINANYENSSTHISEDARPAEKPLYPNVPLNMGLSFGFSLLFGIAGVILYDAVNDKIKDVREIPTNFGVEVLGVIPASREHERSLLKRSFLCEALMEGPREEHDRSRGLAYFRGAKDPVSLPSSHSDHYEESVRRLWSSFKLSNASGTFHSLMVTSGMPGEGKTTVSIQLALANARHDLKTLLIDADLRRPSTHRNLGLSMTPGFADALADVGKWRNSVRQSELDPNLYVLTAGTAREGSLDKLGRTLPELLSLAEREFDLIIVDSPPLLAFAEPLHMATAVDGVLVIACADKTSRSALYSVLRTLQRLRSNVVGITLNQVQGGQNAGYYDYRQYAARPSQPVSA
jgi:succinoglycan biosynthesis transport protein ExoP